MTLTVAVLVPVLGLLVLLGPASSQTLESSVGTLVLRNTDFASQLYRAQAKRSDDNVFLSPLALSTALAALLTATGGQTREQLQRGLALSGLDPEILPGRSGWRGGKGVVFTPAEDQLTVDLVVFRLVPESEGCWGRVQPDPGRGHPAIPGLRGAADLPGPGQHQVWGLG